MRANIVCLILSCSDQFVSGSGSIDLDSNKSLCNLGSSIIDLVDSVSSGTADSWLAHGGSSRVSNFGKGELVNETSLNRNIGHREIRQSCGLARIGESDNEFGLIRVRHSSASIVGRVDQFDCVSATFRGIFSLDSDYIIAGLSDRSASRDLPSERVGKSVATSRSLHEASWGRQVDVQRRSREDELSGCGDSRCSRSVQVSDHTGTKVDRHGVEDDGCILERG